MKRMISRSKTYICYLQQDKMKVRVIKDADGVAKNKVASLGLTVLSLPAETFQFIIEHKAMRPISDSANCIQANVLLCCHQRPSSSCDCGNSPQSSFLGNKGQNCFLLNTKLLPNQDFIHPRSGHDNNFSLLFEILPRLSVKSLFLYFLFFDYVILFPFYSILSCSHTCLLRIHSHSLTHLTLLSLISLSLSHSAINLLYQLPHTLLQLHINLTSTTSQSISLTDLYQIFYPQSTFASLYLVRICHEHHNSISLHSTHLFFVVTSSLSNCFKSVSCVFISLLSNQLSFFQYHCTISGSSFCNQVQILLLMLSGKMRFFVAQITMDFKTKKSKYLLPNKGFINNYLIWESSNHHYTSSKRLTSTKSCVSNNLNTSRPRRLHFILQTPI
ncbi:hypothetical protein VP01_2589g2 [Puccinia sorghi]|uniref:Uncharacterized protein n=1 Tax=Puccinia sorghi TaxID=27349 RepID=A0A0L6V5E1_9BASI|nr:hypothetical protein VP01_2589g2 [Puccinia sorghi]